MTRPILDTPRELWGRPYLINPGPDRPPLIDNFSPSHDDVDIQNLSHYVSHQGGLEY